MKKQLINYGLAICGMVLFVLLFHPTSWWGYVVIVALSLPYRNRDGLIAFWGGVDDLDVVSVCALYQEADRTALTLMGICVYQRAGNEAYQAVCINVKQEARVAMQGICLSYKQIGSEAACRLLGFGLHQSAPTINNRLTPKHYR
jgi:hypothetical protein